MLTRIPGLWIPGSREERAAEDGLECAASRDDELVEKPVHGGFAKAVNPRKNP
jgi:hypothetical protein